ncbi:hypothetical protein [Micavibrio aeruginosavorus]|uniref:hypothetical protein n=1 Tax=Micavibrio aeruginosavorus TaxID=349221 RepID=UPI003F4AD61E
MTTNDQAQKPTTAQKMIAASFGDLLGHLSGARKMQVHTATNEQGWTSITFIPTRDMAEINRHALYMTLSDIQDNPCVKNNPDHLVVDVTALSVRASNPHALVALLSAAGAQKNTRVDNTPERAHAGAAMSGTYELTDAFRQQARNVLQNAPAIVAQLPAMMNYANEDQLYRHVWDIINGMGNDMVHVTYSVSDILAALEAEEPRKGFGTTPAPVLYVH